MDDINAQSLPPVPLSDTCGRLCVWCYMSLTMLCHNKYPPPKSLWIRRLYRVMYMVGNAVIRCELYLCWVEKNYAAGWLIFIMSRMEYTLVMCSKVKYWWSRIIHSLRCFWDICFMSGNILTGTIIWRPSVSMTLNLPRILKSSHLIPTFTLGILHIVLFLFNSFTFCFNTWECLINLFVDKIPIFI